MNPLSNNPILKGESCGQHPKWPNNRSAQFVWTLHEPNTKEFLLSDYPNKQKLTELIQDRGIVLDSGCGLGRLAAEFKRAKPQATIIGLSAHDLIPEYAEKIDRIYYGCIPERRELLIDYTGRISLIIDTFGPMSFSDNPVHVLIYNALLLKEGGSFFCISSTTTQKEDDGKDEPLESKSVLGATRNIIAVKKFFDKYFGVDLNIMSTIVKSNVTQNAFYTDHIIRFRSIGHSYTSDAYDTLCQEADKVIGVPEQGKIWYKPNPPDQLGPQYKEFSIKEKHYPADNV